MEIKIKFLKMGRHEQYYTPRSSQENDFQIKSALDIYLTRLVTFNHPKHSPEPTNK